MTQALLNPGERAHFVARLGVRNEGLKHLSGSIQIMLLVLAHAPIRRPAKFENRNAATLREHHAGVGLVDKGQKPVVSIAHLGVEARELRQLDLLSGCPEAGFLGDAVIAAQQRLLLLDDRSQVINAGGLGCGWLLAGHCSFPLITVWDIGAGGFRKGTTLTSHRIRSTAFNAPRTHAGVYLSRSF